MSLLPYTTCTVMNITHYIRVLSVIIILNSCLVGTGRRDDETRCLTTCERSDRAHISTVRSANLVLFSDTYGRDSAPPHCTESPSPSLHKPRGLKYRTRTTNIVLYQVTLLLCARFLLVLFPFPVRAVTLVLRHFRAECLTVRCDVIRLINCRRFVYIICPV